jgi:DNA-binding response OmpR family regulator
MITADASDPHLLHAIAAGAQGYISKPFTLDQVRLRVATLLHNSTCNPQPAPASHPEQVGGAP